MKINDTKVITSHCVVNVKEKIFDVKNKTQEFHNKFTKIFFLKKRRFLQNKTERNFFRRENA